jgi:hypothetical protein
MVDVHCGPATVRRSPFACHARASFAAALRAAALLLSFALLAMGGQALAAERIALVIGNGAYSSVPTLENPVPDARLIGKALETLGFAVTLLMDTDQTTLNRGIAEFGRALRDAGPDATGLFYYAGHGVQSFGTNYLLPVDVALTDAADLGLVAVPAEAVLRQMRSARNRTNIVILDACRNNPFEAILSLDDNGLAEMKAPTGTFLAYSTAPGAVALDGDDGNSPFTSALAANIPTPGLPIEQLFKQVRVEVLSRTGGAQTPWDTSSLTSEFQFAETAPVSAEEVAARQLWDSVRATRDPVQIMLFMRAYPDSRFDADARALLTEVLAADLAATAPQPAPEPAPRTGPDSMEMALIERAQASGQAQDYEAYLDAYPRGTYAELASYELSVLAAATPGTDAQQEVAVAARPEPPAPPPAEPLRVTYADPLPETLASIGGRSIAQLIQGSPLHTPIEGIPEAMWRDQTCANCHEWTRDALCTQGKTYLGANAARALGKAHPYGGAFKNVLKQWAGAGCE